MSAKTLLFHSSAREAVLRGVKVLARAVKETLGPKGRNVLIGKKWGSPLVTKDGVTVAKEIDLPDHFENMGAQLVKQVADKTSAVAGDGTTTATVLAEAIYEMGLRHVVAGADPMSLKRGVERATTQVVEELSRRSRPVGGTKEIAQVGTVAANGESEIGDVIARAMERVGKDGVITVEEGSSLSTIVEFTEGMQFDKGYASHYFQTDPQAGVCEMEEPYILIHEKKIGPSAQEILPILDKVARMRRPLVIIAESFEGEALAVLVVNRLRGTLPCCAVRAPGYGDRRKEILADIACLTGATPIMESYGITLEGADLSHLGSAKRVKVAKEETLIIEGRGSSDALQARITQIRRQVEETESKYEREKLQERLAKLAGGVAEIQVGAATEVEMKERKARVEDALHATKAAVEEGILPGGGVALLRCASVLDDFEGSPDEKLGAEVVREALREPTRQIARNAGLDASIVEAHILAKKTFDFGFNAATGEYENLVKAGVLDPTLVARSALQNAASVATLLLTTEALVGESPDTGGGEDFSHMDEDEGDDDF